MCKVKVRGITVEQMNQLVEMTRFFYGEDDDTHIFEDPDFPDNIVISSEKGDNYNTVGWYQVCFDLILPKIIDIDQIRVFKEIVSVDDLYYSFINECIINHFHPVDLLYSPFLAIKSEKENG